MTEPTVIPAPAPAPAPGPAEAHAREQHGHAAGSLLPTPRPSQKRRRPTGAPPPLPRSIGSSGKGWLVGMLLMLAWVGTAVASSQVRRTTDRADAAVLRALARARTDTLSDIAGGFARAGSGYGVTAAAVGLLVALAVFRRWRHLFTFIASMAGLAIGGSSIYEAFARPRPYDVTIIGRWAGFALPAPPIAVLTMVLLSVAYSVVPAGRSRTTAKAATAAVITALTLAELILGTYHPSDVIIGVTIATAISVNMFRWFTPNEVFPVAYRTGKTAHLDVTGRRGEALKEAVHDQLGLTITEIKPVGLEGSGGSTPLRLRVQGDPDDTYLFGKLYAMSHVRADRWYKLGRALLYGRLEDETPFQSVRRLVEYEDYAARLLSDIGIPTAAPGGIVEMTPEREYLFVTEFFDGAHEIGESEVDDSIIDQGLAIVRQMWDTGLAHRDIKPANLLVRDGELRLIDVMFVQVRPSPWRQAVDLANMMLVLAVRTDAPRVYERALAYFTPDDIAEAFAAARGVASPSQLRSVMKSDGRDLLKEFRALAPARRPIPLQRWSVRRIVTAAALLAAAFFTVNMVGALLTPSYDIDTVGSPDCGTSNVMILMAQSVPAATSVPCVATLPSGWSLGGLRVRKGESAFWLNSDRGGTHAVEATLRPAAACAVGGATEVPSDEVGMRRFEQPLALPPRLRTTRTYLFEGGCVTYDFDIEGQAVAALVFDADSALAFQPRTVLVEKVKEDSGLRLCGAGVSCPGGTRGGKGG